MSEAGSAFQDDEEELAEEGHLHNDALAQSAFFFFFILSSDVMIEGSCVQVMFAAGLP